VKFRERLLLQLLTAGCGTKLPVSSGGSGATAIEGTADIWPGFLAQRARKHDSVPIRATH
jgi:hypothetical protein